MIHWNRFIFHLLLNLDHFFLSLVWCLRMPWVLNWVASREQLASPFGSVFVVTWVYWECTELILEIIWIQRAVSFLTVAWFFTVFTCPDTWRYLAYRIQLFPIWLHVTEGVLILHHLIWLHRLKLTFYGSLWLPSRRSKIWNFTVSLLLSIILINIAIVRPPYRVPFISSST